jgi:hypothetical protein
MLFPIFVMFMEGDPYKHLPIRIREAQKPFGSATLLPPCYKAFKRLSFALFTWLVRADACRMPQNLVEETMGLASSSSWAGRGAG